MILILSKIVILVAYVLTVLQVHFETGDSFP